MIGEIMQVKTLECSTTNEYLIQLRIDKNEAYTYISAKDLATRVRIALAEKIAAHLFEKVEPVIEQALKNNKTEKK